MDPIEGILKPDARLRNYLIVTIIFSSAATLLSFMAKVYGRSVSVYIHPLAYADMFHQN